MANKIVTIAPPTGGTHATTDITGTTPVVPTGPTEGQTYQFLVGWVLLIALVVAANRTHLGHVIIYYSLLLVILIIVVAEYAQFAPYLNSIQSIGQFNASPGDIPPAAPTKIIGV